MRKLSSRENRDLSKVTEHAYGRPRTPAEELGLQGLGLNTTCPATRLQDPWGLPGSVSVGCLCLPLSTEGKSLHPFRQSQVWSIIGTDLSKLFYTIWFVLQQHSRVVFTPCDIDWGSRVCFQNRNPHMFWVLSSRIQSFIWHLRYIKLNRKIWLFDRFWLTKVAVSHDSTWCTTSGQVWWQYQSLGNSVNRKYCISGWLSTWKLRDFQCLLTCILALKKCGWMAPGAPVFTWVLHVTFQERVKIWQMLVSKNPRKLVQVCDFI